MSQACCTWTSTFKILPEHSPLTIFILFLKSKSIFISYTFCLNTQYTTLSLCGRQNLRGGLRFPPPGIGILYSSLTLGVNLTCENDGKSLP